MMQKINIKRFLYKVRNAYDVTTIVLFILITGVVLSWIIGSVSVMQRNYTLQHTLLQKQREQKVAELEVDAVRYDVEYHKSTEYQELAAREYLGKGFANEKVLILPENSQAAIQAEKTYRNEENLKIQSQARSEEGNLVQWVRFLSGANARGLQNK